MQDMPTIGDGSSGGGGGGGGGGGRFIGMGDRRLRPHNHQNHQPLKCPRCDSLNTKFCYYNNYNLSQPRHFCKSCRRYWTKGGVLRSVPVGGGCRKNKRCKVKGGASPKDTNTKSHVQSSSSESSSLVVAATTTGTVTNSPSTVVEEGSAPNYMTSNTAVLYNFADARFSNINPSENSDFDRQPFNYSSTDSQIFSSELATLMTTSEEMMGFTIADIPTMCGRNQSEQPGENLISGNPVAFSMMDELKIENFSNEALDWGSGSGGGGGDQNLFDLTAEVDPTYWNESEWNHNDQPL